MLQRTRQRLGRLRDCRDRKSKQRTVSLDETVKSESSLRSYQKELQHQQMGSQKQQRALSKATAVLFRRHVSTESLSDDNDAVSARPIRTLREQESLDLETTAPEDTSCTASLAHQCAPQTEKTEDPAVRGRQEAIRAQQKLLGSHHPDVLFSLECLMRFHRSRGEHEEALATFEEKQRLSRESYWNRSPRTPPVIAHE